FLLYKIRRLPRSRLFPYTTLFRSIKNWIPKGMKVSEAITYFKKHASFLQMWHPATFDSESNSIFAIVHFASALIRICTITKKITDRKSTRLNSSHVKISYAVFCLK